MPKVKLITDTAADIPDELAQRLHIDMLSIPITVDGRGYYERESFTVRGFYEVLAQAAELPTTSRIPAPDYVARYKRALDEGYTAVIVTTINAGGSGIYESACAAAGLFYKEYPSAREALAIHVVDSRSYAMGYGFATVRAAEMARDGCGPPEILDYLDDYFSRLEIHLVPYTLEYARKSGRIPAAAAVLGGALGLRPIIAMIDGATRTVDKVRGDKGVHPKLLELFATRCERPEDLLCVVSARVDAYGDDLVELLRRETGRQVPHYKAGASIVINSGPDIVATVQLGKRRPRPG